MAVSEKRLRGYDRGVFQTLLNIYDKAFWENNQQPLAINEFCNKLHRRCLIGSQIRYWERLHRITILLNTKECDLPGMLL